MSGRVICFASAKGGSGKTVITASIGAFLASVGKRVLLVDTDAATNGLTLLYLKEVMIRGDQIRAEKREPLGLYDDAAVSPLDFVVLVPSGADLIPATFRFMNTEDKPLDQYVTALSLVLKVARETYDFILLDAQAGSDVFAQRAMSRAISDTVVIVAEYDPLSAAGVERLKGLMPQDLTYERTWILLNKVLPEFAKNFSDFLEVVRYLSPIPWDSQVVRAYARRRLAIDVENGNAFTLAIMQVAKVLFNEIESEIDQWAKSRAEMIRQPIDRQRQDLEYEFASIVAKSQELADRLNRKERLFHASSMAMVGLSSMLLLVFIYLIIIRKSNGISGISKDSLMIPAAIAGGLAAFVPFVMNFFDNVRGRFYRSAESEVEKSMLDRRRAVIEEQLRRLESLQAGNLETLIRYASSRE